MKNVIKTIAVLAVALIAPLSTLATMDVVPTNPALFYGTVTVNGAVAADGTVVMAYEPDGSRIAESGTVKAGKYAISISTSDGIAVGEAVTFKVNGTVAGTATMINTANTKPTVESNLSITTSSSSSSNSSSGGSPAVKTPTTPTETDTDTTVTAGSDENGRVLGSTDVSVVDGDIIQCKNSADPFAVYIVKIVDGKKYIRHIVSLEIFNHYKHLKWENLIQVQSLDGFSLSGWVRVNTGANGNPGPNDRVWEINGDQTKHWIDMTAAEFLLHGGSDAAIYAINQGELDLYKEGAAVKLQ